MNIPEVRIDKEENHSLHIVGKDGKYECALATVYCDPLEEDSFVFAELIKEAFNTTRRTGKTPNELAKLNDQLLQQRKQLEGCIKDLEATIQELETERQRLTK